MAEKTKAQLDRDFIDRAAENVWGPRRAEALGFNVTPKSSTTPGYNPYEANPLTPADKAGMEALAAGKKLPTPEAP